MVISLCVRLLAALAVIAGVGPGLGFSLAKQFSTTYKVILLSRSQDKLDALANQIIKAGGEVLFGDCIADIGRRNLHRLE